MDFEEVVRTRRSIRKFKPDPVPRELLEKVLELAVWAPSAMNQQNWRFVVVRGEKVDKIREISSRAFREYVKHDLEKVFAKYPCVIKATGRFFDDLGGAPVVVCVYRKSTIEGEVSDIQSVAAATQNLVLAAHYYGLGACWMTGILPLAREINEVVGDVEGELQAIVPIGFPDQTPKPPPRKPNRVFWVGWDE